MRQGLGWFVVVAAVLSAGCLGLGQRPQAQKPQPVERGDLLVQVVETGTLQADKTVEVKSRVSGRVKRLYVDEGDLVQAGQLIAEIDPQETQLQLDQGNAQVRGAMAAADRQSIEIAQRRVAVKNALAKARSNLRQVEMERKVQPTMASSEVASATSAYQSAQQAYSQLVGVTQPNAKTATEIAANDADNSLENARRELTRQQNLLTQGYVSKRDVDNAQLQLQLSQTKQRNAHEALDRLSESQRLEREQAQEHVRQAKADLDRAKANTIQVPVKEEQYQRAVKDVADAENALRDVDAMIAARRQQMAQVEQLRTAVRDNERLLRETRILAPITGIVTKRMVQEGELVASLNSFSAGTTVVMLENRSKMVVKLQINEIDVAKLQFGTPAEVRVDAFPNERFSGRVTKISPSSGTVTAQQGASTGAEAVVKYSVEIALDKGSPKLKSGMSAKCTMKVLERHGVLKVPLEFVGHDDAGDYVMVAPSDTKDPKAKGTRQAVVVGAQSATSVEIVSGVTEGLALVKPDYKGPERKGMMSISAED